MDVLLLGLVVLVGIALRAPLLSDSLNGDELSTYAIATGHGFSDIVRIVQSDQEITPPLYLLLAGWTQGLGDPQECLRVVPFVCGVAAMPLTYLLGVRTVGRRAAVAGAAVMALSPFLIFYSTEARAYALAMVLTLGSTLALLQGLERAGRGWWVLYGVLSCASMYTHYTTAFVLIGQAAWALWYHRSAWRWVLGANVAAAIGWLPWLSSYRADSDSPAAGLIGVLQPFGLSAVKTDLLHWSVGHPLTAFSVRDMPGDKALLLMALGLGLALGAAALELGRDRAWRRPPERVVLVVVLALATPVLAGLYSAVSVSVFLPRNMTSSSPGLVLLLGFVVTRPAARRVWIPATALLLAGMAIGGARMLTTGAQRPDYKGVARFIADRGGPGAVTVDVPGLSPGPFSQLDAPAAPGQANPARPVILRLGRPSRADQLRAMRPGGPGQFAPLAVATPGQIAGQAVRLARGRPLFFVAPGRLTPEVLEGASRAANTPIGEFLAALPARRLLETRTFPGFFGAGAVSVYVLRTR